MAGSNYFYTSIDSPLGRLYLAGSSIGLCRVDFSQMSETSFVSSLEKEFKVKFQKSDTFFTKTIQQLKDYFKGNRKSFDCKLDLSFGTPFQQKVWKTLLKIPYGETQSYQWVAQHIGKPLASRAVGQANGRNPIPIIVPCHRVVSADGGLGGFSSGIHNKKKLLKLEGAI